MRILFLSHYFPPEGAAASARTFAHCKRWASLGHDVTIITCVPNYPTGILYPGYKNRLRQIEEIEGIRVVRVLTYLAPNKAVWKRIVNYVSYMMMAIISSLFERRTDIVIATSGQFFCGLAGVFIGKIWRRPLLLEIRDLWPESIKAVGAMQSGLALRIVEKLEQYMYRSARHIVTVGEGYRHGLIQRGVDPGRISVVMNGVDSELFFPRKRDDALALRLGLSNRFVITYCGAIGLAHGLDVVLRSGVQLHQRGRSEMVFLLVGDGAQLDELRREAVRLRMDNVIFTGAVDRSMIPNFLSISDVCLVHLRKSKTFATVMPSKIFEAAAMARPIILGVEGFAQDFVEHAGCGLCIEPESEDELVRAALLLADDNQVRTRLGAAGYKYVTEAYDRGRLAKRYLRIIEHLVEREEPKRA